jgi:hypothetical protein
VGSYRRTFVLPEGWRDRQVFLHFEGVKSASYVWVNGREVGYNEGGMEPAEYDVTAHVRPGENTLAVRVFLRPGGGCDRRDFPGRRHHAPCRVRPGWPSTGQAGWASISRPSSSTGTRTSSRRSGGGGFSGGLMSRWSRICRIASESVM